MGFVRPIERILVATDFSDRARVAADFAVEIARRLGASLTLLHVYDLPRWSSADAKAWPEMVTRLIARIEVDLASARADLVARSGLPVDVQLKEGDAQDEIARASSDYDLVVLGTHGRTGLRHALLGSVAEKVVRRAACAVLTVRSAAQKFEPP